MNIGLFTDMYSPQISGVVTSACMLEKELTKLGHKVYVFTTSDPRAKCKESRVYRLPSVPLFFLKDSHRMNFFYPPNIILGVKKLKLDVVHTYTEFGLGFFGKLISKVYGIPMVHTYHTMYEDYVHYVANGHLISKKGAQRFSRVFCNRAQVVIAPVEKTRAYLQTIGVKRPMTVIPTGLDFSPFDPAKSKDSLLRQTRASLGLSDSDRVIGVIGRIAKEKSVDVIIDAMPEILAQVPNTKLLIIGDGPVRSALEEQAKSLGIDDSVIFAGSRPWSELPPYYHICDMFTTASTSETQGLTHIEAMAAHVPVVVKKDPSFEGLIRHGDTGYMFNDDNEAASVILYMLNHSEEIKEVAERAFLAIQPLSAEVFAKSLEGVYKGVKKD
jgi:1,2-diacylglycerol 3-alpha-glucosyltransferase